MIRMKGSVSTLFVEADFSHWADVILPLALPQNYTYGIPVNLLSKCVPGVRVEVMLGDKKKYAGILRQISAQKPAYDTKPILNVLDDVPICFPQQLTLWSWMAQYYMCSEGEVMTAALPANFKLSSETILIFNEDFGEDFTGLTDDEFLVAEALLLRNQLQMQEVQQILDGARIYPVIKSLMDKQVCFAWEKLSEKYRSKKQSFIRLHPDYSEETRFEALLNDWKGSEKQMHLILAYWQLYKKEGLVSKKQLLDISGVTSNILQTLCKKAVFIEEKLDIDRIRFSDKKVDIRFQLSDAQQKSKSDIEAAFNQKKVCLLHGVTGSGKTLIYIDLIAACIASGKQALYLLPEIALTSQIIRRLQQHFGGHVAVYHSRFNDQERIELWQKIRDGEVSVVLGARSAIFLPFNNLGLLIVDEEHDSSFKQQDPAPRYHARDAAIYYASLFGASVLLGSGTPSLESYYNTQTGKYSLVTLSERFGGLELPKIEIVNLGQQMQKGKIMLSPALKEKMTQVLAQNKQAILFQNRRGYHPYILCASCGYIPQCIHCDVSLTLHKYSHKLHCHYCGSQYPQPTTCLCCGASNWTEKNFGTEKVEEQLEADFSSSKIARMDIDSVRGKHAHDTLIQQFERQELDVLIGTQMVVKGLDFDHVKLVGILDADALWSFADFRAHERAFQLMEQVSGRAGRKGEAGMVLVQALNVHHPVLQWVQQHDYRSFYDAEIASRETFAYPPFARLIKLTLKHSDKAILQSTSTLLANSLKQDFKEFIVGPAKSAIARIRNQYQEEILLKIPKQLFHSVQTKQTIQYHIDKLRLDKKCRSVRIIADVDPY